MWKPRDNLAQLPNYQGCKLGGQVIGSNPLNTTGSKLSIEGFCINTPLKENSKVVLRVFCRFEILRVCIIVEMFEGSAVSTQMSPWFSLRSILIIVVGGLISRLDRSHKQDKYMPPFYHSTLYLFSKIMRSIKHVSHQMTESQRQIIPFLTKIHKPLLLFGEIRINLTILLAYLLIYLISNKLPPKNDTQAYHLTDRSLLTDGWTDAPLYLSKYTAHVQKRMGHPRAHGSWFRLRSSNANTTYPWIVLSYVKTLKVK